MTQRDAVPDALPLQRHAVDSSRAPGGMRASRRLTILAPPAGGRTSATVTITSTAAWSAWVLWTLTLLLVIGYVPLRLHWYAVATSPGTTLPPLAVTPSLNTLPRVIADISTLADGLVFATLGALIVARARERRIGWLYCAIGLFAATDRFSGVYAISALLVAPGSLPAGLTFAWIQTWTWVVVSGLTFIFIPLLYPTGRLLSRRWRPVAVFAIVLIGGGTVLTAVAPAPLGNNLLDFQVSIANPLGIAALGPVWGAIGLSGLLLLLVLTLLAAASLLLRLRRSCGDEREQLKWFTYVAALVVVVFVLNNLLYSFFPRLPVTLAMDATFSLVGPFVLALLPLLTGLAILRHRLFDIDLLINRTLVYGTLTVSVIGVYVLIVGSLGALFRTGGNLLLSLIATGIVSLLFHPLRVWLQRGVNRLTYGQRNEPYAVVAQLGRRLEGALVAEAVLPAVVETVARALKLPYAAIALQHSEGLQTAAIYGAPVEAALTLPLVYQAEMIGQLMLGPRQRGETFTPADRRLLEDLARQIGVAAHAVQLTADLQRSREQLVTTREEERRRLRRDLHDGLGSALTSLMFKLDATDTLLDRDLPAARMLLAETRSQMQASITDIRRLVYDLRPPTLDEWGLVDALREQVAHAALDDLRVSIKAPAALPPLSAAVEVAVYRIALEALANVVKHARATTCAIHLSLSGSVLTLDVEDDGVGRPAGTHTGVGMAAMRERAAELGGACVIEDAMPRGTRVHASVPLASQ